MSAATTRQWKQKDQDYVVVDNDDPAYDRMIGSRVKGVNAQFKVGGVLKVFLIGQFFWPGTVPSPEPRKENPGNAVEGALWVREVFLGRSSEDLRPRLAPGTTPHS